MRQIVQTGLKYLIPVALIITVACSTGDSIDTSGTATAVAAQTAQAQEAIDATAIAAIEPTQAAAPEDSPTPAPRHSPTPVASPTPAPTPTPTAVLTSAPDTAPTATPTAIPTSAPSPTATPTPTQTPLPSVTASPASLPLLNIVDVVEMITPSVVKIETDRGSGSGVVINTEADGKVYVLTNQHVINLATRISITIRGAELLNVVVVGEDRMRDLAVLSFCCDTDASPVPFASDVQQGDSVASLGYPLDRPGIWASQGVVSEKQFESSADRHELLTNTRITPGDSGGPFVLLDGTIAGISTYSVRQTPQRPLIEGFSFAISAKTLKEVVPGLLAGEVIPAPGPTPQSGATKTVDGVYTNPWFGWTINVPSGWTIDDSNPGLVTISNNQHEAILMVDRGFVGELYQETGDFTYFWTFGPPQSWQDFEMLSEGPINRVRETTGQQIQGHEFEYQFLLDGLDYYGFTHWFVREGWLDEIVMLFPADLWSAPRFGGFRKEMQEILISYRPR